MIKKERERLYELMKAMLNEIATITYEVPPLGVIEFEAMSSEHGRIRGTFYGAEDHREYPWMPCRLVDWDALASEQWHGFKHWKQNYHAFHLPSVDEFVLEARCHLQGLGVARRMQETT